MRAGGLKAAPAPGRSMKRGSACPASPASATEAPAAPATGADGHPAASKAAAAPTLDRDLDGGGAPWDRSAPSPLPARLRAAATAVLARMPERVPYALMAALLLALLAACLVPMVQIAAFDHSYADDWHYGVDAHLALEAGGGLSAALAAAVQEVRDTFFSWQGTYSAILLMALQPGVFSEALYGLGAVAIIAVLAVSTFYACGVAVREVLGADRSTWVAASCLVLLLQTQLIPSPVEGFYWYNSAIYYTFYHALTLVMLGMAVRIARGRTRRGELARAGMLLRAVLLCALALFVAGGNFVAGVVACLLMAGAVVATACLGRPRRALALAPALLVLLAGFALSMAAPGNAERQATQYPDDALGVLPTLLRSGCAAAEYAVLWTGGLLILTLAVALPFMVRAARRSPRAFARPWVPALLAFALFAASFTPTFLLHGKRRAGPRAEYPVRPVRAARVRLRAMARGLVRAPPRALRCARGAAGGGPLVGRGRMARGPRWGRGGGGGGSCCGRGGRRRPLALRRGRGGPCGRGGRGVRGERARRSARPRGVPARCRLPGRVRHRARARHGRVRRRRASRERPHRAFRGGVAVRRHGG